MATAFQLIFEGSQQNPPVVSAASGLGTVVFDDATSTASYVMTVFGLDFGSEFGAAPQTASTSDDVTLMHVHSGARGANGNVALNLLPSADDAQFTGTINGDGSTTMSGVWDTGDTGPTNISTFAAALASATPGNDFGLYFNIHTTANGGGEIRAQWVCIADDNNNTVNGTGGNDFLPGLGGSETVNGLAGDDTLEGGDGDDTLDGGNDNDTATYANTVGVTVSLAIAGAQDTVGAGMDTLSNIENLTGSKTGADSLTGDDLANVLTGLGGADTLAGGLGADTLIGGLGKDLLTGGNNADIFDFNLKTESVKGANRDVIMDFSGVNTPSGDLDLIDLSSIDAKKGHGNQAFHFIGHRQFHHKAGELHVLHKTGFFLVEGDTNGDGHADFQIEVLSTAALAKADFNL
jgi:serralysin